MRILRVLLPASAMTAVLLGLAPAPAQASSAVVPGVSSAASRDVQLVSGGCGRHHHRVWRHGRSFCVRN